MHKEKIPNRIERFTKIFLLSRFVFSTSFYLPVVDTENAFYYDAAKLYLACSIGLCLVLEFSGET